MRSSRTRGSVVAATTVLAPIAWGTTYVTITETLPADRPLLVAALRVLPAGCVLVVIGLVMSRWRPRGVEWGHTALVALFNFALFFPLLFVAVYRLPGGVAAAGGGLQPLFVLLLTAVSAKQRPTAAEFAAAGAAAVGVALVVVRPGAGIDALGVLAAVAANVSFSIGVVLTKRLPAPTNRVAATGWQLLLGGLVLLPLALVAEGPPPALSGRNLLGFAYLGLFGTALAYLLWFDGIRRLPTVAPPLLGLAAPITGAVLGWVVLDEDLSPVQLLGFAVTFGAIAYGAIRAERQPPTGHRSQDGHDGADVREHLGVTATGVPGRSHRGFR